MTKRVDGRHEAILDPGMPIIDAHMHLIDHPELHYMLDDYLDDCRTGHNVVASVYVEAGSFSRKYGPRETCPLGEIEFVNGVAAMMTSDTYGPIRVAAAIVGHVDLCMGAEISDVLAQTHAIAPGRLRGIRQGAMEHSSDIPFRYYRRYFRTARSPVHTATPAFAKASRNWHRPACPSTPTAFTCKCRTSSRWPMRFGKRRSSEPHRDCDERRDVRSAGSRAVRRMAFGADERGAILQHHV